MGLDQPLTQSLILGVGVGAALHVTRPEPLFHSDGSPKYEGWTPLKIALVVAAAWAAYAVWYQGKPLMGADPVVEAAVLMDANANVGGMVQSMVRPDISVGDTFEP